ncbi:succinate--CoA ligase subunit beta, partial [Francisella tularensis]|nr:succinate--CoA ligase subunit beta [Francisella tularensis]
IVRCDMIAEAIIEYVKELNVPAQEVVRLAGNIAENVAIIVADSSFKLIPADNLSDAVDNTVKSTY